MHKQNDIAMLLLMGGKSSRMGTSKAVLTYEGIPFWRRIATEMEECGPLYLSVARIPCEGEVPEEVYLGFDNEITEVYLSANDPSVLSGGFVVYVPSGLATEDNLRTIRKWVEYYKMAGTEYKIVAYE